MIRGGASTWWERVLRRGWRGALRRGWRGRFDVVGGHGGIDVVADVDSTR